MSSYCIFIVVISVVIHVMVNYNYVHIQYLLVVELYIVIQSVCYSGNKDILLGIPVSDNRYRLSYYPIVKSKSKHAIYPLLVGIVVGKLM